MCSFCRSTRMDFLQQIWSWHSRNIRWKNRVILRRIAQTGLRCMLLVPGNLKQKSNCFVELCRSRLLLLLLLSLLRFSSIIWYHYSGPLFHSPGQPVSSSVTWSLPDALTISLHFDRISSYRTVTYEIAVRYGIADPLKRFAITITRGYRIAKSAKEKEVVVKSER
jgi:hypothetical protein